MIIVYDSVIRLPAVELRAAAAAAGSAIVMLEYGWTEEATEAATLDVALPARPPETAAGPPYSRDVLMPEAADDDGDADEQMPVELDVELDGASEDAAEPKAKRPADELLLAAELYEDDDEAWNMASDPQPALELVLFK